MKKKFEYISKNYGNMIHIWEPVFRNNFYYVIAPSYADYSKVVKHHFKIDIDKKSNEVLGNTTCYQKNDNRMVFIWAKNNKPDILAHECFHAVFGELDMRGIKLSFDSDEVFAYMIQFLMKTILENIKCQKK